mmetsp:Transcript_153534/g.265726  ORF Transcript_153534/g.265726 Transcript_153534/m.265726 type:complete len:384 (-) Transcript_153534:84-1235(-)
MWIFRPAEEEAAESTDAETETDIDEKELLAEEAEELRLKLEALRMAEYREAQRAAVLSQGQGNSGVPASSSAASADSAAEADAEAAAVHYHMDVGDGDIESMYDFSDFVADASDDASRREGRDANEDGDQHCTADVEHLRLVEARLKQREQTLQAQVEAQDKKLAAASRALQKTRGQAQALLDQLGSKDSEGSQLNVAAVQLERLLAEKERRLKAALDEAAAALAGEKSAEAPCPHSRGEGGTTQQPQEAPTTAGPRPPEPDTGVGEEQLLQLAAMTEELTDALQQATESEEQVQQQFVTISAELNEERQQRILAEQELNSAREARDMEVNALLARIQEQERSLVAERDRAKDLEVRVRLADQLREAEQKRKRGEVFYPHLEL